MAKAEKKSIISFKMKILADSKTKIDIYNAYELLNNQVKNIEDFFLMSQQQDYYYRDSNGEEIYVTEGTVKEKLRQYIKTNTTATDIETVMNTLLGIKEVIKSKGVQAAGSLPKLYNVESTGGTNNQAKIVSPEPEWMLHYDAKKDIFESNDYKKMADEWISSDEGQIAIKPALVGSGRASAFKTAYTSKKPWYKQFVNDQDKYKKDLEDGLAALLFKLEKLNALPIIKIDEELYRNYPVWVRSYIKSAIENYASYVACDEIKRLDYEKIVDHFNEVQSEILSNYAIELKQIEDFLKSHYVVEEIYLNSRMVRGADLLYREWRNNNSETERLKILNVYQSDKKKQKKIGDVNLFTWLAKDENQNITEATLTKITNYYEALYKKNTSKKCAAFTTANPITSQRYLSYYGEGGTNSPKYKLTSDESLNMHIPILLKSNGEYRDKTVSFKIAYNKQIQGPFNKIDNRERIPTIVNKDIITFTNDKKVLIKNSSSIEYESFTGKIKGAEIRPELRVDGNIKDLFVSYTIEVDSECSNDFLNDSEEASYLFSSAYTGSVNKHLSNIKTENIRALAVDLGIKQFGACAVGRVKLNRESPLQDDVSFERKFMLKLPGEDVSSAVEKIRDDEMLKLYNIKKGISFVSLLRQIYNVPCFEIKQKKICQSLEYYKTKEKHDILESILYQESIEKMNEVIKGVYEHEIDTLNKDMKEFRSGVHTEKQRRGYKPGKSFWAITYYEELRKVIMAWNSISYHIDDDNKLMSKAYGVSATKLLEHINYLKDDRIKTGADMLVQAARGFVYDDEHNCWMEKYEPCNLIVFEDLSRYNFRKDRSRKENSKLMKWSHASIIEEVTRQADVYGIKVITIDASYSSKYHYNTGTPGIRCDNISKNMVDEFGLLKLSFQENLPEELSEIGNRLRERDLVPSEIGSIFVTKNKDGKLVMLNADINAACNLLKRAFLQQTHINSINTENRNGELVIQHLSEDENVGKLKKGKYQLHFNTQKIALKKIGNHFVIVEDNKNLINPVVGENIVYSLQNDPSGVFFPKDEWIGYKEYWDTVRSEIINKLKSTY